jgi:hypothetical protein
VRPELDFLAVEVVFFFGVELELEEVFGLLDEGDGAGLAGASKA